MLSLNRKTIRNVVPATFVQTELSPMTDLLQLSAGITGLISVGLYLAWRQLRVVFLRQDLFAIRDHLWDRAKKSDGFSDPAYREAREALNGVILYAHKLDLFTFAVTRAQGDR